MRPYITLIVFGGLVLSASGCTTIDGYAKIEHFQTDQYCGFRAPIHFTSNSQDVRLNEVLYDFNTANNVDINSVNRTCPPYGGLPPCNIPPAQCKGVVPSIQSHPIGTHLFAFEDFPPGETQWGGLYLRKPNGSYGDYPTGNDIDGARIIMWFIEGNREYTVEATFEKSNEANTWRADFETQF